MPMAPALRHHDDADQDLVDGQRCDGDEFGPQVGLFAPFCEDFSLRLGSDEDVGRRAHREVPHGGSLGRWQARGPRLQRAAQAPPILRLLRCGQQDAWMDRGVNGRLGWLGIARLGRIDSVSSPDPEASEASEASDSDSDSDSDSEPASDSSSESSAWRSCRLERGGRALERVTSSLTPGPLNNHGPPA